MSKKKTTETDATPVQATAQAPAAPAALAAGATADVSRQLVSAKHCEDGSSAGASAEQVTAITASLLTSPRYASCVKDPKEQDRVIGIAISIANKINQAVQQ